MWGTSRWVRRMAQGLVLIASAGLAGAALAGPTLTIGAIVPQSWPSTAEGEELVLGMQLAIKTWPGQPAPTLVIKDSACDPRKAENAARELVAAKVDLVLGSWCAIGIAPRVVAEAGLPFVSANAERLPKAPDGVLQLGRIELYIVEKLAADLRAATGLRVGGRTSCWMNFEPVLREQYDAVLCPVLGFDKKRWEQAEATFTAAHRRPFTASVARGYAAMEAGLAQLRRIRGGKSASNDPIMTIFGPLPPTDVPAQADAMQLVLSPKLPKLSPRDQAAVTQLLQTKACTCLADNSCSKPGPWADQPFVVRGNVPKCPTLAAASPR
ncbi:MAG TPA: hypothetical protein VFY73_14670 [Ideonella sp.]|uniref:hypothetical protein n=1 Tax=Ideonella sp. TaxID=1929293 RepID=UPI002E2FCC26|nr:hypothetical protein [Ideonella sp.]HEX5685264.1 hypothetical protein [Ideonella sp.]